MAKTYDYLYKILLIGGSGAGKTQVLVGLQEDTSFKSTIGVDFIIRTIELDGKKIRLQIWDTAGQESFKTITTSYYRGAKGVMLVYDTANEESFHQIKDWIRNIQEHTTSDVEKMLVGNTCDVSDQKKITTEQGQQFATENGMMFMEMFAKERINVKEAFITLAREIKMKMESKMA